MNFGECPYDDCIDMLDFVEVPSGGGNMYRDKCPTCGRVVWRHLSRIDPWAMTEPDFLDEYVVDEETKSIHPRESP